MVSFAIDSTSTKAEDDVIRKSLLTTLKKYVHRQEKNDDDEERQEISIRKTMAVNFDSENHMSLITQMHGSVLPRVLACCIFNCVMTCLFLYMKVHMDIDWTFSDRGHTFMSLMVSFLVVTRSSIAYSRFLESRDYLDAAMVSCRELIQHVICFTRYDESPGAKKWRSEIARRSIVLLRTLVCILEYPTKHEDVTKKTDLTRDEVQALLLSVGGSNERTPMVLVIFLRTVIASNGDYLKEKMHVNKELRLYTFIADFVAAYHGLMKLTATPFPFPLVQMSRTFLFLWIFTLPLALIHDMTQLPALLILIFFITYGFVGLEYVSMELDDPFGDDPNDFDVRGLSEVVFDDIYIAIHDIDGKDAADNLRKNINMPLQQLTKNTVKSHQRYTSVDTWKSADSHEIPHSHRSKISSVGIRKSKLLKHIDERSEIAMEEHHPRYALGEKDTVNETQEERPRPPARPSLARSNPGRGVGGNRTSTNNNERDDAFSLGAVFQDISMRSLTASLQGGDEEKESHPLLSKKAQNLKNKT